MRDIFELCHKIRDIEQILTEEFRHNLLNYKEFSTKFKEKLLAVRQHLIKEKHRELLNELLELVENYAGSSLEIRRENFQNIVLKLVMMIDEILLQPIEYVKGIGPKVARLLNKLNIRNIRDALYYLPRGYTDRREIPGIFAIIRNNLSYATVRVQIKEIKLIQQRYHRIKSIVTARVSDGHNEAFAKWYNQKYIAENFKVGDEVVLSGPVKKDFASILFENPLIERPTEAGVHARGIIPEYPLTQGVKQKLIRKIIYNLVVNVAPIVYDYIPEIVRKRNNLMRLPVALHKIHFPEDDVDIEHLNSPVYGPRFRLKFDEFFLFQLAILLKKREFEENLSPVKLSVPDNYLVMFQKRLPFKLTRAQRRAVQDIIADFQSGKVMNRLICGDVGSGKTVVALAAVDIVLQNGYQASLMVPTEILAQQHYKTAKELLAEYNVALLTGSTKASERKEIYNKLSTGEIQFVIGTHALIQPDLSFKNLGLVITDEQHRFGVRQRAILKSKGTPHFLVMSATPIPRTLAMTVYGDLSLTIIDELPPTRKPVETYLFHDRAEERRVVYDIIRAELEKGHQAFIVYPLLQSSDSEAMEYIKDATTMAEHLAKIFEQYKVGLVHGKMSGEEKEKIIQEFRQNGIQILVSTTVIEVGIDVPNATVIVIEHAERFGLSQLHQLRGRIGRSSFQSYCIVIASKRISELAYERLKIFTELTDGFKIAEKDLELRGPGELLGTRQHGLPDFKIGNIVTDAPILRRAREEAQWLIEKRITDVLLYYARRYFADKIQLGDVG